MRMNIDNCINIDIKICLCISMLIINKNIMCNIIANYSNKCIHKNNIHVISNNNCIINTNTHYNVMNDIIINTNNITICLTHTV